MSGGGDPLAIAKAVSNDLRLLAGEAKRKHPDVRSACQQAGDALKAISRGQAGSVAPTEALQGDSIMRPLLLACAAKQTKLTVLAMGAMQRLLGLRPIVPRFLTTVVGTLRVQAESKDDSVLIKVLQTLQLAIAPRVLDRPAESTIVQTLGICFRLHAASNPIVHNTAQAALQQMTDLLFERTTTARRDALTAQGMDCSPEALTARLGRLKSQWETAPSAALAGSARAHSSGHGKDDDDDAAGDDSIPGHLSQDSRVALLLFNDLCALCAESIDGGRAPPRGLQWLKLKTGVPASLGLELCEGVLINSSLLFLAEPAFFRALKHTFCPVLVKQLQSAEDFPTVLRLVRLMLVLLTHFHAGLQTECEIFSSLLTRLLEQKSVPLWHRVLALRALHQLCQDKKLLHFLFATFDRGGNSTNVFGTIVHSLGRFVRQSGQGLPVSAKLWQLQPREGKKGSRRGLALHGDNDTPPKSSPIGAVSIAVECLVSVVNCMAELANTALKVGKPPEPHMSPLVSASASAAASPSRSPPRSPKLVMTVPNEGGAGQRGSIGRLARRGGGGAVAQITIESVRQMGDVAWSPLLNALSFLLSRRGDEPHVQHLLMAYQSFANTCGVLGLNKPRDSILASLCTYALQPRYAQEEETAADLVKRLLTCPVNPPPACMLSPVNIQALKALFNIAHCLGNMLGSAWLPVLKTFEQLDTIVQAAGELARRIKRDPSLAHLATLLPNQAELGIMSGALARLFEATRYLEDQAIAHVLSALGTLSLAALANAASTDGLEGTKSGSQGPRPQLRALFAASSTGGSGHAMPHGRDEGGSSGVGGSSSGGMVAANSMEVRMFALCNLIAAIEHNMFRIGSAKLWEIAVGHITCVINHRLPGMRAYGVAALARLTIQALRNTPDGPISSSLRQKLKTGEQINDELAASRQAGADPAAADSTKAGDATAAVAGGQEMSDFQQILLEPFIDLYKSKYYDTKYLILQAVTLMLESRGQELRGGWATLLAILTDAAQAGSATDAATGAGWSKARGELVGLGFGSVQLIVNDFVDCVPLAQHRALITTIGWYCMQREDDNISFTSIGLLWRVSDHLHSLLDAKKSTSELASSELQQQQQQEEEGGEEEESSVEEDRDSAGRLLFEVYSQLLALATDLRSEVRNSAVKTLDNALVAHASGLGYDRCLETMRMHVFPRLDKLLDFTPVDADVRLDKGRSGRSVRMMVHHSRDTPQKQWDETRVYAFAGSARVMCAVFTVAGSLSAASEGDDNKRSQQQQQKQSFLPCFQEYLAFLSAAIRHSSKEVMLAGIAAMHEILLAQASRAVLAAEPELWRQVVPSYAGVVAHNIERAEAIFAKPPGRERDDEGEWDAWEAACTALCASWRGLVTQGRALCSGADVRALLGFCRGLTRLANRRSEQHASQAEQGTLKSSNNPLAFNPFRRPSALQAAALKLGEALPPVSESLWPELMGQLVGYVRGDDVSADASDHSRGLLSLWAYPAFAHQALVTVTSVFTGKMPEAVRATELEGVLSSIQAVLLWASKVRAGTIAAPTRSGERKAAQAELLAQAVASFCEVLQAGLGPLGAAQEDDRQRGERGDGAKGGTAASARVWAGITDTLARYVATEDANGPHACTPQFAQAWEDAQVRMVDCLVSIVLPCSHSTPTEAQWRLLALLAPEHLERVAAQGPDGQRTSERLSAACLKALFGLCSQSCGGDQAQVDIACMAAPVLVSRCAQILRVYLASSLGKKGDSSAAQKQAVFVLSRLPGLRLHPEVATRGLKLPAALLALVPTPSAPAAEASNAANGGGLPPNAAFPAPASRSLEDEDPTGELGPGPMRMAEDIPSPGDSTAAASSESLNVNGTAATIVEGENSNRHSEGSAGHLLALYPVLCQCITAPDEQVRSLLRDVMEQAGRQLGLNLS